MAQKVRILPHLRINDLKNPILLQNIYLNMQEDYYWSDDFSAEFYTLQAKAGFIAVTEVHQGEELLLPEMQKRYAVLDFEDLHISKNVRKLINKNEHTLHIGLLLEPVANRIRAHHKSSWLSDKYLQTLNEVNKRKLGITITATTLKHKGVVTAGEIGYIIGRTYTSLSGFSSREPQYRNNGTLQMVMLSRWLQKHNFAFWNLGQPYMPYKFALGARKYPRELFLHRWLKASRQTL